MLETLCYNNLFENKKNGAFNAWKVLGPLINPSKVKKDKTIKKLNNEGVFHTDKSKISEVLNNFFCTIGETLQQNIPNQNENKFKQYLPENMVNSMYLKPVEQNDVLKEIVKLNPKKSSRTR